MRTRAAVLVGGFLAAVSPAPGATPCPEHLFVVARSKNANVVIYDAQVTPSGVLDPERPVTVYWRMDADRGQREELNRIERQRAYGFDVFVGKEPGTFVMKFKAGKRRSFLVRVRGGCPEAIVTLHGHPATVTRVFVQSKEGGVTPTVEFVEIFGRDVATGADVREKFPS